MLIPAVNTRRLMADHMIGAHGTDPTIPDRPTRRRRGADGRPATIGVLRSATAAALRRAADGLAPLPQGDRRHA